MSRLDTLLSYESVVHIKTTLHVPYPWLSADKFMHNQYHFYIHHTDTTKHLSQDGILAIVFSLMTCEPLL